MSATVAAAFARTHPPTRPRHTKINPAARQPEKSSAGVANGFAILMNGAANPSATCTTLSTITTTRSFASRNPLDQRSSSATATISASGTNMKKPYDGSFDCAAVSKIKLVSSQHHRKASRASCRTPSRIAREHAVMTAGIHGIDPPRRIAM